MVVVVSGTVGVGANGSYAPTVCAQARRSESHGYRIQPYTSAKPAATKRPSGPPSPRGASMWGTQPQAGAGAAPPSHCSGRLGPAASERGVRVKKAGIMITVTSGLATRDRTAGGAAAGIETEGLTVSNPRVSSGQAHFQRQSEANRGENPPA